VARPARAGPRLSRIRSCVQAVARDGDRILVFEGFDPVKKQTFYRPLGGGIEFGERGEDAIRRELLEEIGASVTAVRYLATLENIFEYAGEPGHEIVLLYEVDLDEPPSAERFQGVEETGECFDCVWMPLSAFRDGGPPLYPDGLLELLSAASPAR
jgi:ADP-ribose pyrophosphatase YjhB (NUDIX family)